MRPDSLRLLSGEQLLLGEIAPREGSFKIIIFGEQFFPDRPSFFPPLSLEVMGRINLFECK